MSKAKKSKRAPARKKKAPKPRAAAPSNKQDTATKPKSAPKPKVIPPYVEALGKNHKVQEVPLASIGLADTTFRFRVNLRVGDLVRSIREHGQQLPVLLRKLPRRDDLQIVSGFRRITAIQKIGWSRVSAIVLEDLSDKEAFRVSVLENEARKTYNDLDRAHAIWKYRNMGHQVKEIAEGIFHLSRRQVERLQSLVELPKVLQEAIASEQITTAHALLLKQLQDRLGGLDYRPWIVQTVERKLSVGRLRGAVLASMREHDKDAPIELFVRQTDRASKQPVLRFRPVKVNPAALTEGQRKGLAEALRQALAVVEGAG